MASQMVTPARRGMFLTADGRNVVLTFALVSSQFLLWGFCNGLIDVMDKHFQDELSLSKAQSAWVQFAHYLGYFLMSIPAEWLASRIGYKGGIIAGLSIVAFGGFWFFPATALNNQVRSGAISPQRLRRVPRRCMHHRHRINLLGDCGQPIHDGAGGQALRGEPH